MPRDSMPQKDIRCLGDLMPGRIDAQEIRCPKKRLDAQRSDASKCDLMPERIDARDLMPRRDMRCP